MKYIIGKIFEKRAFAEAFEKAEAGMFISQKKIQLNIVDI